MGLTINQDDSERRQIIIESLDLLEWPTVCRHLSTFAVTQQGRNKCVSFDLPLDISLSEELLRQTLEIGSLDISLDGGISFEGVHDLENILLICSKGGVVMGEDLLKVADTLRAARKLRKLIFDQLIRPRLSVLLKDIATLPDLQKLLEFGLDEGGRIADRASPKLYELRRHRNSVRLQRKDILQDIIRKYGGLLQDNIISERYGRPVLAFKAGTSDQIKGMAHDSSASGNTIYVEPQVVIPIGNRLAQIDSEISAEESRLLAHWSKEVGFNADVMAHLGEILLQIEFALSRARYSKWLNGVPAILDEQENTLFEIKDFRHPLLVWNDFHEKKNTVVPTSFDVPSGLKVVAITGPNTGGKTVALKSIGLAVLMAKAGLLLPCKGSPRLPWCKNILADIGDEQSLQQNLSTFSGHILRISRILDAIATSPGTTLVLLDEVGAGTDPSEGTALAMALLKIMADRARLTIATTHFGELKALKYSDSRFENASVAFDSETIKPTFNLQWGIPGRSNAIEISERLGLDLEVIKRAQEFINPESVDNVNQVIKGLEKQRERQQSAAEDAAALLAKTELLHEELLDNWEKQRQQTEEFNEQGRFKLESSIREGQKEVRHLIKRLRDQNASGETARIAGRRLRQMEMGYRSDRRILHIQSWVPKIGEKVRLSAIGKAGEIISFSDDGMHLTVLCGVFRSTVSLSEVESLNGQKAEINTTVKVKTSQVGKNFSLVRTKKNTLDVRGLRVHEAEGVIEEKLRNCSGALWVIHGIGSGKLKKGLRKWLDSLSYIKKVADAEPHDGGPGCSVIWMVD
ncbi:endonuclease MutS2 [Prochlorococcus sp. MIT 0916]|uniref:endonuclease MutS2 n=1 Tax=Prochlorococcus sp. MIT 0916 TaxID=3082521 RepID=UPI0039B4C207